MSRRRGVGLVGSVCARAQQRRGGVGSREVYVPKPRARVRRRVLLPGAPICCHSCQDSGPPQKCFRPSYSHNTQACRYLVGRSAPLSKHSRLLLYTFKMLYLGNDATLCGARSSSALNMLVTPYTRELRDFNNPRAIRVVPSLRSEHYKSEANLYVCMNTNLHV